MKFGGFCRVREDFNRATALNLLTQSGGPHRQGKIGR